MTKILIAEDEMDLRMGLKTILELSDYQVVEAVNGEEALQLMRSELPDLTLLDMMMPVKDGMQVIQEKQADPAIRHIPIIVLTNFDYGFMKEIAEYGGVIEYVLKANVDLDVIPLKVARLLKTLKPEAPPSA